MHKKIYLLITIVIVIVTLVVIGVTSASSDPNYKLHESIRMQFRPEWVWNEDMKDYDNITDLERSKETGFLILPKTNEELEKHATWDGKLGLYISNDIKINHKTGEITSTVKSETSRKYPEYNFDKNNIIDQKYAQYYAKTSEFTVKHPELSVYYHPLLLLKNREVTKEMLVTDVENINLLKVKLKEGLRTDFVMTMLQLTTNVKMENEASNGSAGKLKYWLEEYNQLIVNARGDIELEDVEKLGYLTLPYIDEQIKAGNYDTYKDILPSLVAEYGKADDKIGKPSNNEDTLTWFEYYKDDIAAIREFISSELEADWLK